MSATAVATPFEAASVDRPDAEEAASFRFGGTRARPRKDIAASFIAGQTYLKPPGSCGSRWPDLSLAIEVECCEKCCIYILDVISQVQISDCRDCRIVIGACTGSVFLLDCIGCTVSVAAAQLRLRDVKDTELRAFAPTTESIVVESCSGIKVRAWDVAYPQLSKQFSSAGWIGVPNQWDRVYNFTPSAEGEPPSFELIPVQEQADTRWCELQLAPSGMCAGSVAEATGVHPTVEGCECPSAAADGTHYNAAWFNAKECEKALTPLPGPAPAEATEGVPASESPRAENNGPTKTSRTSLVSKLIAAFSALFGFQQATQLPEQAAVRAAQHPPPAKKSGERSSLCLLQ